MSLKAHATREWVEAEQPVGKIAGNGQSDEFILIGGHLEAWGKTAICNASGNCLMLELARMFARHKHHLKRSIYFAFWNGHEVAEAAGSAHYVDTHWKELSRHCVGYFNIDNMGIIGTSIPVINSEPLLFDFIAPIVAEVFCREGKKNYMYKGGDHSFLGIGVPYTHIYTTFTDEELETELHWASLGPWLHSDEDTVDKIDKELLDKHLVVNARAIVRLCNADILPYKGVADTLVEDLAKVRESGNDALLSEVSAHASDLKRYADQLEACGQTLERKMQEENTERYQESIDLVNRCLIKVHGSLSHIQRTIAGKYEQDPYDYSYIKKPIPRLHFVMEKMSALPPGSHEYRLWHTRLLRETNMIMDHIQNAVDFLDVALLQIKQKM